MSNSVEPPTSSPTRFASKPGISRSWPRISGIRSDVPPSNGSPSRVPDEGDDRVVAVLGAAALDGRQRRVLVAQLLDDLVDPGVVDRVDLGPEVEVLVVAELDLRADLDDRLEDERLALLGLDDVDLGVGQRQDVRLDEGLAVGVLDEVLDGLLVDHARPEVPFQDGTRGLARTEPRDARPARQPADGVVRGAGETVGGQLDLELDRRLGTGCLGDLHRGEVYGGGRDEGPNGAVGCRSGRRERDRTSTPLTRHRLLRPARLPFRHSPARSLAWPAGAAVRRPGASPSTAGGASMSTDGAPSVCRFVRSRIWARRAWKPSSSVRNSQLRRGLRRGRQERTGDRQQQQRPDAGAIPLGLLGIGREVALQRAADLRRRRRPGRAAPSRPPWGASTRAAARERP